MGETYGIQALAAAVAKAIARYPDEGEPVEAIKPSLAQWMERQEGLSPEHRLPCEGNRACGHGTLALHLDHEQMRGWYALDEGGGRVGPTGLAHLVPNRRHPGLSPAISPVDPWHLTTSLAVCWSSS